MQVQDISMVGAGAGRIGRHAQRKLRAFFALALLWLTASCGRADYAEVPTESAGPYYNASVTPSDQAGTLLIYDNVKTALSFSIDPHPRSDSVFGPREVSMPPSVSASDWLSDETLLVKFQCFVCADQAPIFRDVRVVSRRSVAPAVFEFIPRAQSAVAGSQQLSIVVSARGAVIDAMAIDVDVRQESDPAATYQRPPASLRELAADPVPVPVKQAIEIDMSQSGDHLSLSIRAPADGPLAAWNGKKIDTTFGIDTLRVYATKYNALVTALTGSGDQDLNRWYEDVEKRSVALDGSGGTLKLTEADRDLFLCRLAETGADFVSTLEAQSRELENFLSELQASAQAALDSEPLRVRFANGTRVYVPWQFAYFDPAPNCGRKKSGLRVQGFWGYLLETSTHPSLDWRAENIVSRIELTGASTEAAYSGWTGPDVANAEAHAERLRQRYQEWLKIPKLANLSSLDELESRLRGGADLRLVAFFVHGEISSNPPEQALRLTSAESMPAAAVTKSHVACNLGSVPRRLVREPCFDTPPLVILNACNSGAGAYNPSAELSIVTRFLRMGAGAVVATESPIWAGAAAKFNNMLIDNLIAGHDIQGALFRAQRRLLDDFNNPLGLTYSLYGSPVISVTTPAAIP